MSTSEAPRPYGHFDDHHPPSADRVADCVHCGFCLPTCPTYVLWGREEDSPRGRIHLVKMALEGEAPLDHSLRQHFDSCLGCMGCLSSCPSGVQYDMIIEATRPQLERHVPAKTSDRRFRRFVLALFPHRNRLRWAAILAWFAQKTGLQTLIRKSGVLAKLPARWRTLEALAPPVQLKKALQGSPAPRPVKAPRARVAMLEGCVQSVFFPDVNRATLAVLAAEDIEVVSVPQQGCCGALENHAGDHAQARRRVRALIERFETVDVDYIVVNAAGCGSALKTADRLFAPDELFHPRAKAFARKVKDALELIFELGPRAPLLPLPARVAYHDACHLAHAQGIREAPRALLSRIPELKLLEVPDADVCCGSAGIYNLLHPEPADALGQMKADYVASIKPDILAAANPGCLLQINRHLDEGIRTAHPLELIADSLKPTSG
ncbi:MAG: heterodisulfide reductase-related iron-sulfur binding cluster [Myxococcota bacterium]